MSIIMPSRFISRTTSLPKAVTPFGPSEYSAATTQGRIATVSQTHIPRPKPAQLPQNLDARVDHVASLDSQEDSDLPLTLGSQHVVHGRSQK
jgi:hypothetical protein